jgi:hypothetical protein
MKSKTIFTTIFTLILLVACSVVLFFISKNSNDFIKCTSHCCDLSVIVFSTGNVYSFPPGSRKFSLAIQPVVFSNDNYAGFDARISMKRHESCHLSTAAPPLAAPATLNLGV